MKAYTDIEQSKKLAEILPLESVDMCFVNDGTSIKIDANPYNVRKLMWKDYVVEVIPCWSLAALLDVLPDDLGLLKCFDDGLYYCVSGQYDTSDYNNPVDACFEMILKLHERKLL